MIFLDNNIFFFDRTPGSVHKIDDIKILICSILSGFDKPIDQELLINALLINETVNYFNFCQALSSLIKDELIKKVKNDKSDKLLKISYDGIEVAKTLKDSIPTFIIDKNINTLKKLLEEKKQNEGKVVQIDKVDDGYTVKLNVEDIGTNILEIKLFAPDENTVKLMETKLKRQTVDLYRMIIALMFDDSQTLREIANNIDSLN